MAHHIYHTEGFVLSGRNVGEANRYLVLFTRELGLIKAAAQGIRKIDSRLRYSLQDYSLARIDLVRGRDIWRVTSAKKIELFETVLKDELKFKALARGFRLLERLYQGEEENDAVFREVMSLITFLDKETFTREEMQQFEILFVIRILTLLGYWEEKTDPTLIMSTPSKELLSTVAPQMRNLVSRINQSLRETHL